MKIKHYWVMILAVAGLVTACNRENQPPPPAPQEGQAMAQDSAAKTRDEYLASMDKQMAELDSKIDKLSAKSADATGDAKARIDQTLSDLRAQRDEVRKEYDKLKVKDTSQDVWDKTKAGFQTAWGNLQLAYEKAAAKISGNQ